MLGFVKGAILFGVPNKGMHTSHLRSIVHGQPNESLIARLRPESPFLSELDQQFSNIAFLKYIRFVSAYETMRSRNTEASLSKFLQT